MNILINLNLLSVGIIIAATCILGFVVFFNNPKSITNKTFLAFCLLTVVWGTLNYLSYQIHSPKIAFWLLRFSIFSAIWHSLLLFQFLFVFPKEQSNLPKKYKKILVPLVAIASLLNLTPFTFHHILEIGGDGRIIKIANGPGIVMFSAIIFGLVICAIGAFVRNIKKSTDIPSQQLKPILWGIIFTFSLILIFNFVFPAFLNKSASIAFGAVYIFPFILGSSYAIIKHGLMNVKVVSTEILTFVLASVILFEVIVSTDVVSIIFRTSIFILVVIVGILLIRSVVREVKQRELLEILSKQLAEANEKLKALDQARAEFISIASHQLRTPPATVKWYLSSVLAGDYGKLPKTIKEIITKTERSNNLLISLIEDILNVSRIERGTLEFLFEPVDIKEMAETTFEQLKPLALQKQLKLTFNKLNKKLPKIKADKEKLRQVMNNLIDNAIKYTPKGSVQVSINQTGPDIRFEVKDTGKGMEEEELTEIFKKYTRGKESMKHSAGLGLGLYVAKIVVEQHQGKIWAESDGVGKGSSFCFTIPINVKNQETSQVDLAKEYSKAP